MRKKAVGLLGNMQGDKRPIPFVEDTAVPPENLADLHRRVPRCARPTRARLRDVRPRGRRRAARAAGDRPQGSGAAAPDPGGHRGGGEITRKHGGLLWGEHGKGVRSEFSPKFFGPLYPTLQAIKAAFDPENRLNPGKIAAAGASGLLAVDGVPMKGGFDRTIPPGVRAGFDEALHCNGNGACYNWDPDDPMCPSWKGHTGAAALAEGPGAADPGMAAPARGAGLRPCRGKPAPARPSGLADPAGAPPQHPRAPPRRTGLLARGQGGARRLPRLQVLHRPVPDQGRRPDLPGEVLRALLRPLSAPAPGLCGGARSSTSSP